MRLLVILCGCTLIIGDRRGNSAPEDMMLGGLDGGGGDGGGSVCSVSQDKQINGANQIDPMEAADVAAVGNGYFAVVFAQSGTLFTTQVGTSSLDSTNPAVEMQIGPEMLFTCAGGCRDARVAMATSGDANAWFSAISGTATQVASAQLPNLQMGMTLPPVDCGGIDQSAGVGSTGTDAVALTACGGGFQISGTSVSPGPFTQTSMPSAVAVRQLRSQSLIVGAWSYQAVNQWTATVATIDPKSGMVRSMVNVPPELRAINGIAVDVIDGTPAQALVAYALGSAPAELWFRTATFDGHISSPVRVGSVASVGAHMPLGVAAAHDYFMISYSSATVPTRAMLQRVSQTGDLLGPAVALGADGVPGFAPRVAYSPDGDRFGVVWAGPPDATHTDRVAHFAVVKCH